MMPEGDSLLPLAEMIRASEAVRISSLAALAGQQKRAFAAGCPPTALSAPGSSAASSRRHSRLQSLSGSIREKMSNASRSSVVTVLNVPAEEGAGTSSNNNGCVTRRPTMELRRISLQSSPPSPPLTPKIIPDEPQGSMCEPPSLPVKAARQPVNTMKPARVSAPRHNTGATIHTPQYPEANAFGSFCSEALGYQKDVKKPMPMPVPAPYSRPPSCKSSSSSSIRSRDWVAGGWGERSRMCRCGYDWYGWLAQEDLKLVLKDGFRLTARFLGKSHCCAQGGPAADRADLGAGGGCSGRAGWSGGFGCVLCATAAPSPALASASAPVRVYAHVDALRDHINHAHTKWQMLHDPDMAGLWGVAIIP